MVDARGLLCPMPVIMVQKEVKANAREALDVLVDDPCAVENVTRFAHSCGYEVAVTEEGADGKLALKKGASLSPPFTPISPR